MEKNNILHLSHTFIQSDSRILKEMTSLTNLGENFQIYGIGLDKDFGSIQGKGSNNFSIQSLKLFSEKLRLVPSIIKQVSSIIEMTIRFYFRGKKLNPKVVHCHDVFSLPAGVLLKKSINCKLIYDAHELESETNGLNRILSRAIFYTEKLSKNIVDFLIVVSPSILNWYKEKIGFKYGDVILNSPIVDTNTQIVKTDYLRKKFKISDNHKIFIYVGMLSRGRGIDKIIDVFTSKSIEAHLVFLGYGDWDKKLKNISSEYRNIYVHDVVSHEKVVEIVKSADVGLCFIENVSLSDYYCLPNKLFEYAFSGLPVLASNLPDISFIIEKYNLGKSTEMKSENISNAISEFISLGYLPVVEPKNIFDLSWKAQEEKLIVIYNNLIEGKTNK